ncbi:hypothetical protein HKX48_001429 [Thoreauomyces humboldtii]|nr:hypothetical protein HKX48_001429 [Thoreauomyces humboldtii]
MRGSLPKVTTAVLWLTLGAIPLVVGMQTGVVGVGQSLARRGFEGENTQDPSVNASAYYFELTKPEYGLFIWTNLARLTRSNLRNGATHLPLPNITKTDGSTTVTYDQHALIMYFIPVMAFLGSLLITFITTCCSGCCLCCCKKRLGRRQKDPFTTRQKVFAIIGLAFVCLAWSSAVAGGISGSHFFGQSLTILSDTVDKTFSDSKNLATGFENVVNSVFDYIVTAVNHVIYDINHFVDFSALTPISTAMNTMATSCTSTNAQLVTLGATAKAYTAAKVSLSQTNGAMDQLDASFAAVKTAIDNLQSVTKSFSYSGSGVPVTYTYTRSHPGTPLYPDGSSLNSDKTTMKSDPNLGNSVAAILAGMPNLTAIADVATASAANLTARLIGLQSDAISTITSSISSNLGPVQTTIGDSFANVYLQIDNLTTQTTTYTDYRGKYELYRMIGFSVIYALPAVILLFVLGGVGGRRPGLVKCCLCGSVPYALLALLLTMLLVILSVIFGEVCTLAFDRTDNGTAPLASLVMSYDATYGKDYENIIIARDLCLNGGTVMSAIELFFPVDQFDITTQADQEIDSQDFSGVANAITYTGLIGTSSDPSSVQDIVTQLHNAIQADPTGDLTDFINGLQPGGTVANTISAAITDLNGHTVTGLSSACSTDSNCVTAATNDLVDNHIHDLLTILTGYSATGGLLTVAYNYAEQAQTAKTSMLSSTAPSGSVATSANAVANNYQTMKTDLINFVEAAKQNITDGITDVQSEMKNSISTAQTMIMTNNVTCKEIAKDTVDFEIGVCDGVLTGLDAFWFAFFILGVVGATTIPVFISSANVLADKSASSPKKGSTSGKKAFDSGKPKEKAKAKGKDKDVEAGQIKWSAPKVADPAAGEKNVQKTAIMSPSDAEIPSPDKRIYPTIDVENVPDYNAEGNRGRASSDSKRPLLADPGVHSPASVRTSMHGSPSQGYASPRSSSQHPPYVHTEDDIQEMRPSWLGGAGNSGVMQSPYAPSDGGQAAYSPKPRHPYTPISPSQSYVDTSEQPQYPDQRRVSSVAQHPEYESVVSEFSKRNSHQPQFPNPDQGYYPQQQPQHPQPQYGGQYHDSQYGQPPQRRFDEGGNDEDGGHYQ